MQRHAEPGGTQHWQVISAVANSQCLRNRNVVRRGDFVQLVVLGVLVDNRFCNGTGQGVALELENVGMRLIKPDALGDVISKESEATGHQDRMSAIGLHGVHEGAATGCVGDAFTTHFLDALAVQTLKQCNPRVERSREIEFAIHCPRCDIRHLFLETKRVGEFIYAFFVDHGGIHVRDEHLLAPVGEGDVRGIDGQIADHLTRHFQWRRQLRLDNLAGDIAREPVDLAMGDVVYLVYKLGSQDRLGRIGDETEYGHRERIQRRMKRRAVLIAGPTASGKSALALDLARETGGVIVNADSMQVYGVLSIVTARPQPEDIAVAPHRLYGFVAPSERYSTGAWFSDVSALLAEPELAETPLIFVGGTGLYFESLINGVATVPEVSDAIVAEIEAEVVGLDRQGRGALLADRDPEMAARIREPDRQRVVRALSVLAATGKSLAHWQNAGQEGLLGDFEVERIVLNPDRDVLRARIATRFEAMFESGAVDEVKALLAMKLDPSLPVMKAIGVREIGGWLAGDIEREVAIEKAVIATRQFAKRQRTWFRNRMADWEWRS